MILLAMLTALLGCDGSNAPPPGEPSPELESPPAESAPARGLHLADENTHVERSSQWMVIIHSGHTGEPVPGTIAALVDAPPDGATIQRLSSSRFKGLMPCFDIVIAGASPEREAALALSAQLTTAGIDNYVKNAGEYVGADDRLDAMCQTDAPSACVSNMRIVVPAGGQPHLALHLDPARAERSVSGAAQLNPDSDNYTSWTAPLPAQQIADVKQGDTWTATNVETGESKTCTVAGFSAVVRGQPHFGWYDSGNKDQPACGTLEPMARLDCGTPLDGEAWIAQPGDGSNVVVYALQDTSTAHTQDWIQREAADALAAGEAHAQEQGLPLQTTITERAASHAGRTLQLSSIHLQTGTGHNTCGGEDLNTTLHALVQTNADRVSPVIQLHDTTFRTVIGVFEVDGNPYTFTRSWTGSLDITGADGNTQCSLQKDYCDCPC